MNYLMGIFAPLWRESTRQALFRIAPLLILLLAAYLRLHNLEVQSLWNDEGNSLRLAERSAPDLIAATNRDIHPPGYYLALKGWYALTGDSELALRSLSALMSILAVACVYALGKHLFAPGVGVMSALLTAVNTFSIYYAQEARMYAQLQLVAAASMLAFILWLKHPTWLRACVLALINAAGLYTQYVFPFVMIVQGILFLLRRDFKRLRLFNALNALTLLLFLPQLSTAWTQVVGWPRTGQPVAVGDGLLTILQWLTFGNTAVNISAWIYIVAIILALAGLLPDWLPDQSLSSRWRRLLPLLWLIIAIAPFFALGLFREANLKFLLPAQIAVALLVGRGLWWLWSIGSPNLFLFSESWPRFVALIALWYGGMVQLKTVNALYSNPHFFRADYRQMARIVDTASRDGDAVILDAPNQEEVFRHYYQGEVPIYPLPTGLGGDDATTKTQLEQVINTHSRIYVLYWGEMERDPNRVVEKTLTEHAVEVSSAWYADVRFVIYAVPPSTLSPLPFQPTKFGNAISLLSIDSSPTTLHPGDVLALNLHWQTDQKLDKRYKVFLHLLDANGIIVQQRDGEPGNNMALTTTWTPNVPVDDPQGLLIPQTLPDGDYRLIVGLYDLDNSLDRLPVNGSDILLLTTITVIR
ncbi:MAG: glycosyltransferase family 39 protein [Anaerolineae bacterium]|nr:glycosyltransferase family 39 protein [Anaerolineae bacterium]